MHMGKLWAAGPIALSGVFLLGASQFARGQADVSLAGSAHWIGVSSESASGAARGSLPVFRREFNVRAKISRATLTISGMGQYEAHVNGRIVSDALLTPSWSDYRKRVYCSVYDVTALLVPGKNAIGVMLGNGMYNVEQTPGRYAKFHGSFGALKMIAELWIQYADGSHEKVDSDNRWKYAPGPVTFSSIYGGEDEDARLEEVGWDEAGLHDKRWKDAAEVAGPGGTLVVDTMPPVKAFERYEPVLITYPKPGTSVYDLGENFAGWPEIEVSGQRGSAVKLIPGELLDERGFVTQRSAAESPSNQTSFTYVLKGEGKETWHPRFTYYGFRYVQVETSGADMSIVKHLDGRFLHDALVTNGEFTSSNELLNRIHVLITRAMLSNLFSVMTDCPQREKLGWLEQTHLASGALMYNYDLSEVYAKISDDMADAQLSNGMVPDIAPEFTQFSGDFRDSPEWGAAIVLSPWAAYQFYGDREQLRRHVTQMQQYVSYLDSRTRDHLLAYGLGDWYDIGPGAPGPSKLTGRGLTATAVFYQCLTTLSHVYTVLGDTAQAAQYGSRAAAVRDAFNRRYFHEDTDQYDTGSQTANAMPLALGLVPEGREQAVLQNLIADIRMHENHVTAGDIGFRYVVRALTDGDRSDVLYDMLSRTDKPSYGDQLEHGATTLTEAWDANPSSSQNHLMLGHADEWFYRGLAGIDFDMSRGPEKQIVIHPAIVGTLKSAGATFHSRLGTIRSAWSRTGEAVDFDLTVPEGAVATMIFPPAFSNTLTDDGRPLGEVRSIRDCKASATGMSCVVNAGTYRFRGERRL